MFKESDIKIGGYNYIGKWSFNRELTIVEQACKILGLVFKEETTVYRQYNRKRVRVIPEHVRTLENGTKVRVKRHLRRINGSWQ